MSELKEKFLVIMNDQWAFCKQCVFYDQQAHNCFAASVKVNDPSEVIDPDNVNCELFKRILTAVADAVEALPYKPTAQHLRRSLSWGYTSAHRHYERHNIIIWLRTQAKGKKDYPKDGIDEAAEDALREPPGSIHVLTQEESEAEDRMEGKEER